ncbi:MAG: HvfC/BufC family peptide modification chaperone [Gallionella sp.]
MLAAPKIFAQWAAAITQSAPPPCGVQATGDYDVNVGLAVYRNNYRGNLHDALAGAYPVMVQLVGAPFFKQLARDFIALHPSRSANLFDYGAQLAEFLRRYAATQTLAYLPDMAALEWACHRAYLAADAPVLNLSELAQVAPDAYAELYLQLHPAVQVLTSCYPIAAIWQAHQSTLAADFSLDLAQGGGAVLVLRQQNWVRLEPLAAADANWLCAILAGQSLGDATARTVSEHSAFNLPELLLKLVQLDALTGFHLGEKS